MPLNPEIQPDYEIESYGKSLDPIDKSISQAVINGYIWWSLESFRRRKKKDENLWIAFHEQFEGWTKDTFSKATRLAIAELRDYLREHGVYVAKKPKLSITNVLANILNEEEQEKWPEEELEKQKLIGNLDSKLVVSTIPMSPIKPIGVYVSMHQSLPSQHYQSKEENKSQVNIPNILPQITQVYPEQCISGISKPYESGQLPYDPINQPRPLRSPPHEMTGQYGKVLGLLAKLYTSDKKYSGGDDALDEKLDIFYNLCNQAGVPQEAYRIAVSAMFKEKAEIFFYRRIVNRGFNFEQVINMIKDHFETEERRQLKQHEWDRASFRNTISKNPGKSILECFEMLVDHLEAIQKCLGMEYRTEAMIRDRLINACRGALCSQIRTSIVTIQGEEKDDPISNVLLTNSNSTETLLTDRRYYSPSKDKNYSRSGSHTSWRKKCFVCQKIGCWSTNHSQIDQDKANELFKSRLRYSGKNYDDKRIQQYISEWEGVSEENVILDFDSFIMSSDNISDNDSTDIDHNSSTFIISFGNIDGYEAITKLANISTYHFITKKIPGMELKDTYVTGQYYSDLTFQGIMIDTGAARFSTAGQAQVRALQRLDNSIQLNTITAGIANIQFGIGMTSSIGTVHIDTPVGKVIFHVVNVDIPFLLCLHDMDEFHIIFDNLEDVLIQKGNRIPIIRKFDHAFMQLSLQPLMESLTNCYLNTHNTLTCYLTECELRQLHRRFGHPSSQRLERLLTRAGHNIEHKILEKLTKFCHICQIHSKSPGRFKFTLYDDCDFNNTIYIDVMYINGDPVLHIIDEATRFEAARWLKSMTAQHTWDALRACWIDVYIGPPDKITHDAGTNFDSKEFRQYATSLAIELKQVPVEAYQSIGLVERYHAPLRRAYMIIQSELEGKGISKDGLLQIAVKAINDTAGPEGLVPTLLVFGAYPRMTLLDQPAPSITQRAMAISKAMKEVREYRAHCQVNDALAMRNGPKSNIWNLPINSEVLVWRESGKWTGPWKLVAIHEQTCTVELPSGPTDFRITSVKPYLREKEKISITKEINTEKSLDLEEDSGNALNDQVRPQRKRQVPLRYRNDNQMNTFLNDIVINSVWISTKEINDLELSKQLRVQGIIDDKGDPFQMSRQKELDGLRKNGVFELIPYNKYDMMGMRIFKSRFVDEIKGKGTIKPYEKSRLVIQAFGDDGKNGILTQSPTIQRVSQRIIMALAISIMNKFGDTYKVYIRDVSQAYVQSVTKLARTVLAYPPKEIVQSLPKNTIMQIMKPLYGIPEAGTHWFATYINHHREKLYMNQSTFDPCLLYTTKKGLFGVVGMQTDDTLFIGNNLFTKKEAEELSKANILAKPIDILSKENPLIFNGGKLFIDNNSISFIQKQQADRIKLIDYKSKDFAQVYIEQRARGAYISTICQPEAAFDLSIAAQHTQDPSEEDVKSLNKRLQWQIDNKNRGLRFLPIDMDISKLFVFVDGSFANNKDLSSQIGYIIVWATENQDSPEGTMIKGNIIHWSSTKCKRITRSVLASELYAMVQGIDLAIAIKSTLDLIFNQLGISNIPIVICTDSYSLYDCMVKLGTTNEKRLMIDVMAIRQSYERRELSEIRWINGEDNPADTMTKINPNNALRKMIDNNELCIREKGWVDREKLDLDN